MFFDGTCIFVLSFNTTSLYRSNKYAATLPALLLARHKESKIESIPLAGTHMQDIVQIVTNALLETFVSMRCNKSLFEVLPGLLKIVDVSTRFVQPVVAQGILFCGLHIHWVALFCCSLMMYTAFVVHS
jgi:hypothetical protein